MRRKYREFVDRIRRLIYGEEEEEEKKSGVSIEIVA